MAPTTPTQPFIAINANPNAQTKVGLRFGGRSHARSPHHVCVPHTANSAHPQLRKPHSRLPTLLPTVGMVASCGRTCRGGKPQRLSEIHLVGLAEFRPATS
jgi:hypothetical protein